MIEIEPYEIGRMYRVPTVTGEDQFGNVEVWPVLGDAHEDLKLIGFKQIHYHYDARFLTDRQINRISSRGHRDTNEAVFALVISFEEGDPVSPVVMRFRKCRRAYDEYPARRAHWMKRLESAYQGAKLDERLICPHRGASLQGLKPVDGCVTCPLHGLRWDCKTGELRKREKNANQ